LQRHGKPFTPAKERVPHFKRIDIAMRIAQVAPLSESVPPKLYGGTERVVSFLTDELVRLGHSVTLFASGDSRTIATLDRRALTRSDYSGPVEITSRPMF
jgi:hypothetical protein